MGDHGRFLCTKIHSETNKKELTKNNRSNTSTYTFIDINIEIDQLLFYSSLIAITLVAWGWLHSWKIFLQLFDDSGSCPNVLSTLKLTFLPKVAGVGSITFVRLRTCVFLMQFWGQRAGPESLAGAAEGPGPCPQEPGLCSLLGPRQGEGYCHLSREQHTPHPLSAENERQSWWAHDIWHATLEQWEKQHKHNKKMHGASQSHHLPPLVLWLHFLSCVTPMCEHVCVAASGRSSTLGNTKQNRTESAAYRFSMVSAWLEHVRIMAYVTNGSEDHLVADVLKDVGFRAVNRTEHLPHRSCWRRWDMGWWRAWPRSCRGRKQFWREGDADKGSL